MALTAKFCSECGRASAPAPEKFTAPDTYTPKHLADKILTSKAALEGERKSVTVMFSDVSGFTAMSERLDPEEVHAIMDRAFEVILGAVHRYEGTINQFLGDGESVQVGLPRPARGYGRRVARIAESPHPRPRARAQRHPPLHRGSDHPRHYGGLVREWICRPRRVVAGLQAPAHQQPLHPLADRRQRCRDLGVARCRRRLKRQRAPGRIGKHPVQHEGVKVQVHVQPAACALHHGDAAGASTRHAALPGAARVHVEQHARVHAQHRAAQPVIPRHLVPEPIRHRQDPLSHRHLR